MMTLRPEKLSEIEALRDEVVQTFGTIHDLIAEFTRDLIERGQLS
jgi:hypothetical protein